MQINYEDKRELLTIGEAAEYLGISIDTLRRWEKKGRIEPFRSPGGHRYFEKKTLDNLFGKRYTRDEETIRRSAKSDSVIDTTQTVNIPETETEKITPIAEPIDPETQKKDENVLETADTSKPIGLPYWRAVKEIDYETKIEKAEEIAPQILGRPAREVKIPETMTVRVIESLSTTLSSEEAYFNQQSTSVLTPPVVSPVSPTYETYPTNQTATKTETPESKSELNLNQIISKNKNIIYIGGFILILILAVVWYIAWRNSQVVLSPVP